MGLIALSAGLSTDSSTTDDKKDKPLFCNQKSFDAGIEVVIKMLDKLDHYDRVFAQE